jgi:hypothetical protein
MHRRDGTPRPRYRKFFCVSFDFEREKRRTLEACILTAWATVHGGSVNASAVNFQTGA